MIEDIYNQHCNEFSIIIIQIKIQIINAPIMDSINVWSKILRSRSIMNELSTQVSGYELSFSKFYKFLLKKTSSMNNLFLLKRILNISSFYNLEVLQTIRGQTLVPFKTLEN